MSKPQVFPHLSIFLWNLPFSWQSVWQLVCFPNYFFWTQVECKHWGSNLDTVYPPITFVYYTVRTSFFLLSVICCHCLQDQTMAVQGGSLFPIPTNKKHLFLYLMAGRSAFLQLLAAASYLTHTHRFRDTRPLLLPRLWAKYCLQWTGLKQACVGVLPSRNNMRCQAVLMLALLPALFSFLY